MKKYLLRVWDELKNGQNFDVYLTIFVCFILLMMDILGIASLEAVLSGILAVLLLITLNSLNIRQVNGDLQKEISNIQLSQTSINFFHEWDDAFFTSRLATAKEIKIMAISPYDFIIHNSEKLKEVINRGANLQLIMTEPDGTAVNGAPIMFYGAAKQIEYISHHMRMTLRELQEIAISSSVENVKVKLVDVLPPYVMTMITGQTDDTTIFVTLNGISQPGVSRPSFRLRKISDGKWFDFYQKSFENLWCCPESKDVEIENIV